MPNKDQYTSEEFRELIKTPQKQLKAKKVKDLTRWLCTYDDNNAKLLNHGGWFLPKGIDYLLPDEMPVFSISLPGIGPSLNHIWSRSLSVRDLYKIKKSWKQCTWLWLKKFYSDKYGHHLLDGKYMAFFVGQFGHGHNIYDSLNLAPTAKMIEDALTRKNPYDADSVTLADDNPDIIETMTCIPFRGQMASGTWSHFYLYETW